MSHVDPPQVCDEENYANLCGFLGLTLREAEVLAWIAQGKTNHEIGVILGACTGTICKHVEHIFTKLNVENRTAAAAIALQDHRTHGSRAILAGRATR